MRDIPHINSALDAQEKKLEEHENRLNGIEGWKDDMASLLQTTNERLHEVAMAISGDPKLGIKGIVSAVEEVGKKHDRLTSIVMKAVWGVGGASFIVVVIWEGFKFYAQYLQDKH